MTYDRDNEELNIDIDVPEQNDITDIEIRYMNDEFADDRSETTLWDNSISGDIAGTTQSKILSVTQSSHYFVHIYTQTGAGKYSEEVKNNQNVQSIALTTSPIIKNIRDPESDDLDYQNREEITIVFESDVRLDTDETYVNFELIDSTSGPVNVQETSISPNRYEANWTISPDNQKPNGTYNLKINAVAVS
jgi:hypothetical protein